MSKITFEKLSDLLVEELRTFEIKNKMYGNSVEISLDKYGVIAGLTRISDKFNRLENLILTQSDGTSDERLEDTLIDMANYCNMLALYVRQSKASEKIPNPQCSDDIRPDDPSIIYQYGGNDHSFGSSETLVGAIRQSSQEDIHYAKSN